MVGIAKLQDMQWVGKAGIFGISAGLGLTRVKRLNWATITLFMNWRRARSRVCACMHAWYAGVKGKKAKIGFGHSSQARNQ